MLARDPCRQEAAQLSMQGLLALGQPEQAIRTYETFRRVLDQELGLTPGEDLERLYKEARAR